MMAVLYQMLNADARRAAYAAMFPTATEDDARAAAEYLYGAKPGFQILHICRMK